MENLFEQEQHLLGQNEELLDDSSLANLRHYKYSAIDLSPTTKYVLNPFWTRCAEFMPPWLAPNCITLIGISAILSNLLLVLIYIPDLYSEAPRWIYFYFAFSLLFYQTMDNIDGKQARKTGTSSPLGELFDHGIDSLNCCWAGLVATASMGLGPTWLGAVTTFSTCMAMYFSTWENYYTHTLFLGVLNGPTEGLLVAAAAHCISGFYGPRVWDTKIGLFGDTELKLLWTAAVILSVIVGHVPSCLYNVHKALVERHEQKAFKETLRMLLPFLAITLAMTFWISSPTSTILADNHLFICAMAFSFTFARTTTAIILSHLCEQPFPSLSFLALFVYLGAILYGLLPRAGIFVDDIFSELGFLRLWLVVSTVYFFFYSKLVIDKLCGYLGIQAFVVPR